MTQQPTIPATLAFVFNQNLSRVLLIKKSKPVFHAGLLNGLGGKLEAGETHLECVVREIEEEAGLKIDKANWQSVGTISWTQWQVSIWTSVYTGQSPQKFPDENVSWYPISPLPSNIISNLGWLIPLSLDINQAVLSKEKSLPKVEIIYS